MSALLLASSIGFLCLARAVGSDCAWDVTFEQLHLKTHIVIRDIDDACCAEAKAWHNVSAPMPHCLGGKTFSILGSYKDGACSGDACVVPHPHIYNPHYNLTYLAFFDLSDDCCKVAQKSAGIPICLPPEGWCMAYHGVMNWELALSGGATLVDWLMW